MKKLRYLLLMTILLIPVSGKAAMHCSAPSSVESGETFGVTFYGNIGGSAPIWFAKLAGEGNVSYSSGSLTVAGEEVSNFSRTVYYTAGNPGSAKFYAYDVDVASDSDSFSNSDTCSVSIIEATKPNGVSANIYDATNNDNNTEVDPDKSSNNNLKSLSIDGVKLSPAFNKDKLEYTGVVSGDKEKINIKGEIEDDKASVDGFGEKELKEGINKFEVKVTAENGVVKTYVISVTRKEKNPIEVTINKKKYTVAKKEIGLKVPEGFTKTSIVIDKEEVVGYSNSFTGYLIVALVDEDGNAGWFIYNQKNGTYRKYSEFESKGLRLIVLEANKKDVPYNYKKCKVDIGGELVDGYALQLGSTFRLIYALNMDNGEKAFYLYDMKENTFQRFYNNQVELYRELLKKLEMGLIVLAALILIMFIIIISQHIINKKTKKIIKNGGKIKEEEPILEDEEEQEEKREELKNKIKEKSEDIDKRRLELARTKKFQKPLVNEEQEEQEDKTKKTVEEDTLSVPLNIIDKKRFSKKDIDREFKTDTFNVPLNKTEDNMNDKVEEEEPLTREEIRRRKREEKEELAAMRRDFFD